MRLCEFGELQKNSYKTLTSGDLQKYELFFGVFGFLLSLKLLWDHETADNFVFSRVSFKRSYERKEILSNDNYTLNNQKGTIKSTKLWRNEIKLTNIHSLTWQTILHFTHYALLYYYFILSLKLQYTFDIVNFRYNEHLNFTNKSPFHFVLL